MLKTSRPFIFLISSEFPQNILKTAKRYTKKTILKTEKLDVSIINKQLPF